MRRRGRGARDDRCGARQRAQGDARVQSRRDECRHRGGSASRPGRRVGGSRRQPSHHRRSLSRGRREGGSLRVLGPSRARRDPRVTTTYRIGVAIFAIALALVGLVALALVWSGGWAYAALANLNGVRSVEFVGTGPTSLDMLLFYHRNLSDYVAGHAAFLTLGPLAGVFTADEFAHMEDVRSVFIGAQTGAVLALGVVVFRLARAGARGDALRLLRDGALVAAGLVALVGLTALVAFDQLFLLFHEVFFPLGNFLFDPARSNLLRMYPEWYWQGITAGVAVSFIALALLAALISHSALRRRSNTYSRAA